DMPVLAADDALRTIAAFRLALPRTVLRYAGGRELTLGDLGTEAGVLGGINAIIVGHYLTTLRRPAARDLGIPERLHMPIQAPSRPPPAATRGAPLRAPRPRGRPPLGRGISLPSMGKKTFRDHKTAHHFALFCRAPGPLPGGVFAGIRLPRQYGRHPAPWVAAG